MPNKITDVQRRLLILLFLSVVTPLLSIDFFSQRLDIYTLGVVVERDIRAQQDIEIEDAIDDDETGFLCRTKDAKDLAAKMEKVVKMTDNKRKEMGTAARKKMVKEFDEKFILNAYLQICHQLLELEK